jgi:hypothetical protein
LNNGDISGAWEKLHEGGDNYAAASADVTSGSGFFSHVVERYWDRVYGTGVWETKGADVATDHLQNYINKIRETNTGAPNENFDLPSTDFIEDSYADALVGNGLSKDGAIDLALNQIDNTPFDMPLTDYIDRYYPGGDKIGLDPDLPMPDWHKILEFAYGSFGERTHENSDNFTNQTFGEALKNLGIAGILGGLDWVNEKVGELPGYINEQMERNSRWLQRLVSV